MTTKTKKSLIRAVSRCIRVAVAVILSGLAVYVSNDPKYAVLIPLLNGIAKYVREQYGIDIKIL